MDDFGRIANEWRKDGNRRLLRVQGSRSALKPVLQSLSCGDAFADAQFSDLCLAFDSNLNCLPLPTGDEYRTDRNVGYR